MSNAVADFLNALKRTINGDPYPAAVPVRYAPVSYRVVDCRDPLKGQMLADKYCIESRIGKGAMATVYKAIQQPIDRVVAIKILSQTYSIDEIAVKRFKLEAKTLSSLRHRNILSVHDLGNTDRGQPFFVMEFLDGISLESLIAKRGPIPVARAVPIFGQICDGMAYAHMQGIIHRDLKPDNVMLLREESGDESVKLVDFGIVKVDRKSQLASQKLTRKGEVWGSPIYMSPEQCKGEPLDARSDVYAMGLLMYESLLGIPAISGSNIAAIVSAQMSTLPPSFHEAVPQLRIPETLERIVFRAIEKKPADRFASMEELKAALESFAAQYGIKLRKTTGLYAKPNLKQSENVDDDTIRPFANRLRESEASTQPGPAHQDAPRAASSAANNAAQSRTASSAESPAKQTESPATPQRPAMSIETVSTQSSPGSNDILLFLAAAVVALLVVGGGIMLYLNFNKEAAPAEVKKNENLPVSRLEKKHDDAAQTEETKAVDKNENASVSTSKEEPEPVVDVEPEPAALKRMEAFEAKSAEPRKVTKPVQHKVAKVKKQVQPKQASMSDDELIEKWTMRKHKSDSTQQWLNVQEKERQ